MITYTSSCVSCPHEMGCIGDYCQYKNVPVVTCDECGCEIEDEYIKYDGYHLCEKCFMDIVEAERVKI